MSLKSSFETVDSQVRIRQRRW